MKKIIIIAILFLSVYVYSQESKDIMVEKYLKTSSIKVYEPLFSEVENVNGKSFEVEDLIMNRYIHHQYSRPEARDVLEWESFGLYKWKTSKTNEEGIVSIRSTKAKYQLSYLVFYLNNDEWADVDMVFTTAQMLEIFIDGEKIKGKYTLEEKGSEKTLTVNAKLVANNHFVVVKTLLSAEKNKEWGVSCKLKLNNKENNVNLTTSLDSEYLMDIDHILNGIHIQSTQISAAGDYYFIKYEMINKKGESFTITDIKRLSDHSSIQLFYGSEVSFIKWAPFDNVLTYSTNLNDKYWIWEYDLDNGKRIPVAIDIENLNSFAWAPNGEFLVITSKEVAEENSSDLKRFENMADHWPYFKNRNNLSVIDIISGVKTPLTYGHTSNNLQDISPNGQYILFSQHIFDESERPYAKQVLIQYDRLNRRIDTLWNKFGNSNVHYSPNGNKLIVLAGPTFFGKVNAKLNSKEISNDFDNQAYIYNIRRGRATLITRDFNPSIVNANWDFIDDKYIYFTASEDTYVNEYQYNIKTEEFVKLTSGLDVIDEVSYSKAKPLMVYNGSSISSPKKAYIMDVSVDAYHILDYPEQKFFDKIELGFVQEWNFENKEGDTIEGRIYYPPNFDENKEYPMIVYYHGGTDPTERRFRGRYPKNLFAAKGYIVYVLQPSEVTAYGQDFSVEHINKWGKSVAEEILQGTRLLCQTHSYIDSTNVGCMGVSHGGFATMYLNTYTNFFKAAISHVGIGSISSYWGEGYWRYLYTQVASANSFPWNNIQSNTVQSPLDSTEKVTTPILLMYGNIDTNAPPGESKQFYTALKKLDREVELIEIDKQNDQITEYNNRILWQKTILSWFDKNLKDQPDWWYHLYPKNNL